MAETLSYPRQLAQATQFKSRGEQVRGAGNAEISDGWKSGGQHSQEDRQSGGTGSRLETRGQESKWEDLQTQCSQWQRTWWQDQEERVFANGGLVYLDQPSFGKT